MSAFADDECAAPEEDERAMSEINTTPLVDVMLVLLIVFMITIPVITHTVPRRVAERAQRGDEDRRRRTSISP